MPAKPARTLDRGGSIAASTIDDSAGLAPAPALRYDYDQIAPAVRRQVEQAAVAIKRHEQQVRAGILVVGQRLAEVKALLPHGQFSDWCAQEFDLSQRTAQNMMNVAARFGGKNETVSFLSDTALYLLAAPSTPETARAQVLAEAQTAGSSPTKARVQEVIAQHRPPPARVRYVSPDDDWPAPDDDLPVRQIERPAPSVVQSSAPGSRQAGAPLGKCAVCGRPLSDPIHAAAGCGPVCSAKRAANFVSAGDDDESATSSPASLLAAWALRCHNNTQRRLDALRGQLAGLLDALDEYQALTGDYAGAADLRQAAAGPLHLLTALLTGDKMDVETEETM